jgi:hypothetical protein
MGADGAATISKRVRVASSAVGATAAFASVVLSANTVQPLPQPPAVPLAATVTRASNPRLIASERAKLSDTCIADEALARRFLRIKSVKEGAASAAKIAAIAITTSNSISVKPRKGKAALAYDFSVTEQGIALANLGNRNFMGCIVPSSTERTANNEKATDERFSIITQRS